MYIYDTLTAAVADKGIRYFKSLVYWFYFRIISIWSFIGAQEIKIFLSISAKPQPIMIH